MATIEEVSLLDAPLPVKTILIVEDDNDISAFLELAIAQETHYYPFIATGAAQAREAVKHIKPALLLLDFYLQNTTGIELYDELHALECLAYIPAILFTAANLRDYQQEIEQRHLRVMNKPVDLDELLKTITSLLE